MDHHKAFDLGYQDQKGGKAFRPPTNHRMAGAYAEGWATAKRDVKVEV